MADDDDGYEDWDWGWDDYEPTEQEQLQVYITNDAADPDSELLAWRQAQRWEQLAAEIEDSTERAQQGIKKARKGSDRHRPTWWKLWSPPELKETGGKPNGDDPRLIKQGDLTIRQEIKTRDFHSLYGDSRTQPIRLTEDYQIWMEFQPDELFPGFPDLRFLNSSVVTYDMMHGRWGWWDSEKGVFRSRIWGAVSYRDQAQPELVTDFAVQMVQPPPYGLWLPTIVDYERNSDA